MDKRNYYAIVAGGRYFNDYELLCRKLDFYLSNKAKNYNIVIVSGTANGADKLGEKYAFNHNYKVLKFPANWSKYGNAAGPIRNRQMADIANACIVFWNGKSKGSKNMIETAKNKNLPTKIIYY